MGRDVETRILIKAKTEGFQQAQQQVEQVTKTASAALEKQIKGFDVAQQAIAKFVQQTVAAGQKVAAAGGGAGGTRPPGMAGAPAGGGGGGKGDKLQIDFAPLIEHLTDLKEAIQEMSSGQKQKFEQEQKDREARDKREKDKEDASKKRSFWQGFFQTSMGGDVAGFLDDKPGMKRQIAGQYLGRHARGLATGFGTTMLEGSSGLAQLMQAVPVLGGVLGPVTGNLVQYSQMAKNYEKQMLGLAPYLFGAQGGRIPRAGAGGKALKEITGHGLDLSGLAATESLQFAGGVLQTGGGNIMELRRQNMMGAMFGAKTAYGLDEGTIGTFLRAGRRGGIAGVTPGQAGAGGQALASTIGDAVRLGLEDSEMQKYMQIVSEGIEKWDTSGIPFSRDAFQGFAELLSKSGVGGVRGARVAGGLVQGIQGIADRGPQTGYDIAAMKIFGGWTGRGGAMEYAQTMARMEQLKMGGGKGVEEKKLQEFVNLLLASGGGGGTGILAARKGLEGLNVKMAFRELILMQKLREGKELEPEEKSEMKRLGRERKTGAARAPETAADLEAQAAGVMKEWGSVVKAVSGIQNQQLDAGKMMLGTVLRLDSAAVNLTKNLGRELMPAFEGLAKVVTTASEGLADVFKYGPGFVKEQAKEMFLGSGGLMSAAESAAKRIALERQQQLGQH